MKATEVMVGDWVLDGKKPAQITGIMCDDIFETTLSPSVGGECITPIPLTHEILEKNGFVEFTSDNWQIVIDNIMIELRAPEHNMAIWLDWDEHDTGTYASYMFPRPDCVHELQHALRFCEIDKEIELNEEITKKLKEALDAFMVNPKKGNAMLDQIHNEQNKRCCKNCKNFVPFNQACMMRGYDMYRCINHDFKDFEAK